MSGQATKSPTLYDFIVAVLQKLGAPVTTFNVAVLAALALSEGRGLAGWNPFDSEQKETGSTAFNTAGVQSYTSFQQGVDATVQTLTNGLYGPLITGLKESQPISYYTTGPGFKSLVTWQRGPKGASSPPPAWANVLLAKTVSQLVSYAKLVSGGSSSAPASTSSSSSSSNVQLESASDPCAGKTGWDAVICQLTQFPSNVASTANPLAGLQATFGAITLVAMRAFWVLLGVGLIGFGILLIFANDIEKVGEQIGDASEKVAEKVAPAAVLA